MDSTEKAVERVVEAMYQKLGERYTIDDMARTAMFSKFHFTRMFQRVTGLSPARFLSALRLEEAKRLLTSTSLSVTDICHRVGYNSPGTFSSRFSACVGVSPTGYRQNGGSTKHIEIDSRPNIANRRKASLRGHITLPDHSEHGLIFCGLFRDPIPQGLPASCAILERPGAYVLRNVPYGTWYFLAHSVVPESADTNDTQGKIMLVGASNPITIRPEMDVVSEDIVLRPMRILDPPVLLALLDIRNAVSAKVGDGPTTNSPVSAGAR